MTRRLLLTLLWAVAALTAGLAPAQAQCTAPPEDAAAAQAAIEGAVLGPWPMEVPRGLQISDSGDFRGALLVTGSTVYQIDSITWRITERGALDFQELVGHTRDGVTTHVVRTGGTALTRVVDAGGFILGNPDGNGRKIQVESLRFATDRDGFVTIEKLIGVDLGTGEAIALAASQDPTPGVLCGLRVATGCSASNCVGGPCGDAPGCPCKGKSGSCSGYSNSICSGTCPDGLVCNGSVEDCKCIPKPPAPPAGGGGGDATGGGF